MINLHAQVEEIFAAFQAPLFEIWDQALFDRSLRIIARHQARGIPERVGDVIYCKDGYAFKAVAPPPRAKPRGGHMTKHGWVKDAS